MTDTLSIAAAPLALGTTMRRVARYAAASVQRALSDFSFVFFIVALPSAIFLFFATIYGNQPTSAGFKVDTFMMVSMAAYGGMGAAMSAGTAMQTERANGWFRQLQLTPLTSAEFFVSRLVVAVVLMVPAIGAVFVCGALRGVSLDGTRWLAAAGVLVVTLIPMIAMGIAIALWFSPQTAAPATTFMTLLLSMLGGLWFPMSMMPEGLAAVGRLLPSYRALDVANWTLAGGDFPWQSITLLASWTAALVVLGVVGYRRAVRNSRR